MRVSKTLRQEIALWFLENKATVRATGEHFGLSKSTVHVNLRKASREGMRDVGKLLRYNQQVATLRGGEATRLKYQQKK